MKTNCVRCGVSVENVALFRTSPKGEMDPDMMCISCIEKTEPELAKNTREDFGKITDDLQGVSFAMFNEQNIQNFDPQQKYFREKLFPIAKVPVAYGDANEFQKMWFDSVEQISGEVPCTYCDEKIPNGIISRIEHTTKCSGEEKRIEECIRNFSRETGIPYKALKEFCDQMKRK